MMPLLSSHDELIAYNLLCISYDEPIFKTQTKIEAKRLKATTKWGAIKRVTKMISHFDGSNNVFDVYTYMMPLLSTHDELIAYNLLLFSN